ncbi:MAG: sugar phosphate nucleotidyltransferase, partial [Clostridia bacterium]
TKDSGEIYEFEEKPENPKSTNASMGIYIFSWKKLKKYLQEDENDKQSENDFGKNIIPKMLNDGQKLFAYNFEGYWKDVGTIDSLWEANMDLLNVKVPLNLSDKDWRIYARNTSYPPHFVGSNAKIKESIITEGCDIDGQLWYSVLFSGVVVQEDAMINSSVIMEKATIKKGAKVSYAIIANDAIIEEGAIVGAAPEDYENRDDWGIAVVGRGAVVKKGQIVLPKEMIEPDYGKE